MLQALRADLSSAYDGTVVRELLSAYEEAKRNFYLGGLRLSAVEGGRFCEAAFRMLQQRTTGAFTRLGRTVDTDGLIRQLGQLPTGVEPDSVRLHIPRALRVVYDIRNKRDAAHLGDGIDPNLQDATLVVGILDWVMAEFVRLHHSVTAEEAQRIVGNLVTRAAPAIEEFGGFLKVLNPGLSASEHVLLLLYQRGMEGATYEELRAWVAPRMRANLRRTLHRLEFERSYIHGAQGRYVIARTGLQEVERRRLYELPTAAPA